MTWLACPLWDFRRARRGVEPYPGRLEWVLTVVHSQLVTSCPASWDYLRELLFWSTRRFSPADYAASWGVSGFTHAGFLLGGGDVDWAFFGTECRTDWAWFVQPVVGATGLTVWQAEAAKAQRDVVGIVEAMLRSNGSSVDPRLRAEPPTLGHDETRGIDVMVLPPNIPGAFFSVVAALLCGATLRFLPTATWT